MKKLTETSAGGSTGASSIAVDMSAGGRRDVRKYSLVDFMNSFTKKVKNRYNPYVIKITEDFDIENVFSRLAGMERASSNSERQGVTFGIEDDQGNLMKVTVEPSQAVEFEAEVANYLADLKRTANNLPSYDGQKNVSMAELLYKMKDKFNIIDVEFPEIPKDLIYNVDKASSPKDLPPQEDNIQDGEQDFDVESDMGTDMDIDSSDGEIPLDDELGGDEDFGELDADLEDEDSDVSEFLPNEEESEGSILSKVIDMLKAQAESDIEKAKADAEKAKAEQARYTAQATQNAMRDQEEKLRYELEIEEEKKKEKEARTMADMAKHRISKTMSTVSEADEGVSPEMVMRQKQQVAMRYRVEPDDTMLDKQYKSKQKAEAMREMTSRYRQAMNRHRYENAKKEEEERAKSEEKANQRRDNRNQQDQNQRQDQQNNLNRNQRTNQSMNQNMGNDNEI